MNTVERKKGYSIVPVHTPRIAALFVNVLSLRLLQFARYVFYIYMFLIILGNLFYCSLQNVYFAIPGDEQLLSNMRGANTQEETVAKYTVRQQCSCLYDLEYPL